MDYTGVYFSFSVYAFHSYFHHEVQLNKFAGTSILFLIFCCDLNDSKTSFQEKIFIILTQYTISDEVTYRYLGYMAQYS